MLNRRLTGGLAWAGLLLVIGVPSADLITRNFSPQAEETAVAVKEPVPNQTAAPAKTVEVAVKPAAQSVLPPIVPAKQPVAQAKPDPIQTASTGGSPVDQYLSKGKKLPSYISGGEAGTPVAGKPAAPVTEVANVPAKELVAPIPMPASMRPKPRVVAVQPVEEEPLVVRRVGGPVPPADVIGPDELEDWDSGSLADYLARKGLLSGSVESYYFGE